MDTNTDRFTITLKIAGIEFKPKILRSEEEIYRRATEEINKAYELYRQKYSKVDRDTLLMAVTLQFAVNNIKNRHHLQDFISQIDEVNLVLEEFLKQE